MPVKERLPNITIKEVLPLAPTKPDILEKPLVLKDLVTFDVSHLNVTSLNTRPERNGSDVTCQTKCTACRTDPGYPKASCDICVTPEGCDDNPKPAARFGKRK